MSAGLQPFSIVGRRYSAGSSHRFSPFFSDRFERRGLVYVGADYSNLSIHDESYQYDLNGNRELVTNANGDLVVYSTGSNNELTSDSAYTYAYDAEGNRISKTNAAGTERELYEWDYRNRLSSVTKQEYNATTQEWEDVQIVEYAYDYNNVLIRKVLDANGDGTADSKTLFLPENYQTAIQLDDADLSDSTYETVSHRYLWTPQNQDKLLADVTPTETLWTLSDHLGTIRDIIQQTPTGLIQKAHVIYDAYGNVLSCKDANGTDIESPVLFGFTGKYFDADTQLQNNVNRWYDATTGRWLSTDPIGFNGNDTNLYRYVGNRLKTDPNGLLSFDQIRTAHSLTIEQFLELFNKNDYDSTMALVYNEYFKDPIHKYNLIRYNLTHRTFYPTELDNIVIIGQQYQNELELGTITDSDNYMKRTRLHYFVSPQQIINVQAFYYFNQNTALFQDIYGNEKAKGMLLNYNEPSNIDKYTCLKIDSNREIRLDFKNNNPAMNYRFWDKRAKWQLWLYGTPSYNLNSPFGPQLKKQGIWGIGVEEDY